MLDVGISLMCLLCFDAGLSPFCSCNDEMFKTFCCMVKRHGCDAATNACISKGAVVVKAPQVRFIERSRHERFVECLKVAVGTCLI